MNVNHEVAGPCATATKHGAGTGKESIVFGSIMRADRGYLAREAGLPGRVDRATILCRSCGAETDGIEICPACADALRAEWADGLGEQCRGRRVEDLPVSELDEMQRGWC